MATLKGAPELRRRLKAIQTITKPTTSVGGLSPSTEWQAATARIARQMVPSRTGKTRASIRPGGVRRGNPRVVGFYTVNFIDAGSKAHVIPRQYARFTPTGRISRRKRGSGKMLKFQVGGRTVFRKKVDKPSIAARPFKKEAARRGEQAVRWGEILVALWNRAA
jgi:hypothetical protein